MLAATDTLTVAEPLLPAPTVTQDAPDAVVHAHPLVVVTLTFADPDAALKVSAVAESVNAHGTGAFCVTVTGTPATVTVPVRLAPVLAVTVTVTVPEPVLPAVTEIQDAPELVFHPQVLSVVTVSDDELAGASKVSALEETAYVHGWGTCDVPPPATLATKFETVATLLFNARALSCDAVPVGALLYLTSGLEKYGTRVSPP